MTVDRDSLKTSPNRSLTTKKKSSDLESGLFKFILVFVFIKTIII
ncbi:hypothetical protein FM106_31745 [Brachybacterium faecium]|nr:hypothetical protein FM106_31745 [Brachybacterium faecium]